MFLKKKVKLWNAVELSPYTIPEPNRLSGTYFWVLIVMAVSALFGALALLLYLDGEMECGPTREGILLSFVVFWILVFGLDQLYFLLARPMPKRTYTQSEINRMINSDA